jgi:molybdate transport system ATP-binding protein
MNSRTAALLHAHLVVRRDTGFRLDVTVSVAPGEVVALVGPNGAGKTTALRALAGLTPLTDGRIQVGERALDDPAGRLWVAPEHRPVGMVFQDYLLFPHLSALENVAFGPRSRGAGRRQARSSAADWLRRVGLGEYAGRKPRHLSGGQASTPGPGWRPAPNCAGTCRPTRAPPCWSPTTRWTPSCSRTACW